MYEFVSAQTWALGTKTSKMSFVIITPPVLGIFSIMDTSSGV